MPTEDRRVGKLLPSPVTPSTTVCYVIQIPNAVQYRAAFLGQLDVLGRADTWDHPRDGTECAPCDEAAQLWRTALYNATFSDDCEMDMTCLDVADCIETSPAVQNAIGAVTGGSPLFGQPYAPGQPLTPSQMNAQLNVPDECGFDVFWAQADQYVEFMVDLGTDTFERLQLYSEALASGKNAVGGQFIAKLKNGSTVGKVTEFLNWAVGTMKAAYESADTLENRTALKCALFCAMRDDCLISIQGTLNVLNDRLGGVLSPSDLDDLPALAEAMQTIVFNPALAMDLWILFLMGTAKTAGLFGVQGIDETVQLVLAVASNDPSDDWELLCEDCNNPGEMISLTKIGYSGEVFGVVPPTAEDAVPFLVQSTTGPAHPGDRLFAFIMDKPCTLTIVSSDWSFCSNSPSAALWGYCPVTAPDPTNLAYWIFTRENSGATTIPIDTPIDCLGLWVESACGIDFTASINLTIIAP